MQARRASYPSTEKEDSSWNQFWHGTDEDPPGWLAIALLGVIGFATWYFGIRHDV